MNPRKIIATFALCLLAFAAASAQDAVPTNRYAMKLEQKPDGTYALQREDRYAKILNLKEIPDLYVPYVHQNDRLTGKLYNKVQTEEIVYKKYDTYELRIEDVEEILEKRKRSVKWAPWAQENMGIAPEDLKRWIREMPNPSVARKPK